MTSPQTTQACRKARMSSPLRLSLSLSFLLSLTGAAGLPGLGRADEGGVSFWLPGQYSSFAAIAPAPGVSLPMQSYCYTGDADGDKDLPRGGKLSAGLSTDYCAQFIAPTWTPDTTIFGARPSFSLAFFPGWNKTSADVNIDEASFRDSDTVTGWGDLFPTAQLFWNTGVHNWMAYVTGDIPVGSYDADRLSNLGLGHAAIDVGGAYTYLNTSTGWEVSATAGLTYNFENPDTDYTSGIDSHLDLGLAHFLTDQFFAGLVGYAYVQLTADKGQPSALGSMKSRSFAIGPQIGYTFNAAGRPIYANLRGYYEFGVRNRTEGGSIFLTVNLPLSKPQAAQ